jgi:hypothetical protein
MSAAASAARQASAVQATEEEEETSFLDLEVVTKHGITKTDVNKFKEAGFHTVLHIFEMLMVLKCPELS